jgi:hypothetical protein
MQRPNFLLEYHTLLVVELSAVFIPHEVFTPQKYVHSSTRGSAEGGYPLCGVRGGYPPGWGVWGQAGGGSGAKPPKQKLPYKSIL